MGAISREGAQAKLNEIFRQASVDPQILPVPEVGGAGPFTAEIKGTGIAHGYNVVSSIIRAIRQIERNNQWRMPHDWTVVESLKSGQIYLIKNNFDS